MTEATGEFSLSQEESLSARIIRESLSEFTTQEKIPVEKVKVGDSVAFRAILTPEPEGELAETVYTVDLDDTLNHYSEAKACFHHRIKKIIIE